MKRIIAVILLTFLSVTVFGLFSRDLAPANVRNDVEKGGFYWRIVTAVVNVQKDHLQSMRCWYAKEKPMG